MNMDQVNHYTIDAKGGAYQGVASAYQTTGTPFRWAQTTHRDSNRHCTQSQCNRCVVELGPGQSRRGLPAEEPHTLSLAQPEAALRAAEEPAGGAPRQRQLEQVRGAALEQQQPEGGSQWDARGHGPVWDQHVTKTHVGVRIVAKSPLRTTV